MSRPRPIAEVLAQLFAKRGYARERSSGELAAVWNEAVGAPFAAQTRVGEIRRGVLEVIIANSTLMQELMFQKVAVLATLQARAPDQRITDVRFKVGHV